MSGDASYQPDMSSFTVYIKYKYWLIKRHTYIPVSFLSNLKKTYCKRLFWNIESINLWDVEIIFFTSCLEEKKLNILNEIKDSLHFLV